MQEVNFILHFYAHMASHNNSFMSHEIAILNFHPDVSYIRIKFIVFLIIKSINVYLYYAEYIPISAELWQRLYMPQPESTTLRAYVRHYPIIDLNMNRHEFNVLWTLITANCDGANPQIASLHLQEYCDLWPQQTVLPYGCKSMILLDFWGLNSFKLYTF